MNQLSSDNKNQLINQNLNSDDLAEMLKSFDTENGVFEVTSEYIDFDEGIESLFVFIGMTKISNTFQKDSNDDSTKFVPAVKLIDEDGRTRVSASAVLVGACSELIAPSPIKVIPTGMVKGKNGTYQNLRVFVLTKERKLEKENTVKVGSVTEKRSDEKKVEKSK